MLIEQAKVDPGVRGSSHLAAGRPLALVFRRPRNLPTSSELTVVSTFVSTSEVLEGRLLAGRCPRRGAPPGAHPTRPAQCGAACSGISWWHRPACGADATGDLLPDAVIAAVAARAQRRDRHPGPRLRSVPVGPPPAAGWQPIFVKIPIGVPAIANGIGIAEVRRTGFHGDRCALSLSGGQSCDVRR